MEFTNKWLICTDCGMQFLWDVGEQQWYYAMHLTHRPQRCKSCRDRKRKQRAMKTCQVLQTQT